MKIICYQLCTKVGEQEILTPVQMDWSDANEAIAKAEAHKGEYSICEDERKAFVPGAGDWVEAQVVYTAMMTDTLLEV